MTSTWMVAHVLTLAHGLAAALASIGVFYLAGLVLLPRRWSGPVRWPDSIVLGLTSYVLLCWVATTSRNLHLSYVMVAYAGAIWGLTSLKFRWLQVTLGTPLLSTSARRWLVDFSILYVFAYALARPVAGAILTTAPDGALDLVTYARYAKQLLAFGTADVELASFEYLRSPASPYLLAWHSLSFVGDPLDAAMPALFMLAALFGVIAADVSRSAFGLSRRASMAIAAIAVCAPMFRWTLAAYSLGELLAAMAMIYLTGVVSAAVVTRRLSVPLIPCMAAGGMLLYFAGRASLGEPSLIASGVAEAVRYFSPLAVFGLPSRIPAQRANDALRSAALLMLPFVPVFWAAVAYSLRRSSVLDRVMNSPTDRQLARTLVVYVGAAVIIGNVTVQAVASPPRVRWSSAWRQLAQIGRMPFRSVTLKVAEEPNGVSTALAMYYFPGRNADVIGRGVAPDELPFENVSRQQPMFIQNYGCEGVGHDDTMSAPGVGCVLMAPPSMTVGVSYPFNRTFLFMNFDRMTAREPGGRWNTQPTLNLKLTADPQRVRLDREMYVNFLVSPFLPAGAKSLSLVLRWGRDRREEVVVGERQWLSLPISSDDWSGNRVWSLPVAIDFPDGRTILFQEVALTDSPREHLGQPVQAAP